MNTLTLLRHSHTPKRMNPLESGNGMTLSVAVLVFFFNPYFSPLLVQISEEHIVVCSIRLLLVVAVMDTAASSCS